MTGVSFANCRNGFYREPRLNKSESTALDRRADALDVENDNVEASSTMRRSSTERNVAFSTSAPLSPHSIDER